jgi:hypothetical protein
LLNFGIPSHVRISNIVTAAKAKKRVPPMYAIICTGMLLFLVTFIHKDSVENEKFKNLRKV